MKQTIKTSRTAGYLEKIFRALNEHYLHMFILSLFSLIHNIYRFWNQCLESLPWQ